jgi:hypothetical protein
MKSYPVPIDEVRKAVIAHDTPEGPELSNA